MLNTREEEMLTKLRDLISYGVLTPAKQVDSETVICFTERRATDLIYWQCVFEVMPKDFQDLFKGHTVGTQLATFKIVAIFHTWPEAGPRVPAPPKTYAA